MGHLQNHWLRWLSYGKDTKNDVLNRIYFNVFLLFVKCQYLPLLQLQINLDSRLKMPILVNPESERASSVLG